MQWRRTTAGERTTPFPITTEPGPISCRRTRRDASGLGMEILLAHPVNDLFHWCYNPARS